MIRLAAVVAVAMVTLAACSRGPARVLGTEGEELFHNACARCHGDDGTGGPDDPLGHPGARNFTDPVFQRSKTDAQIKQAIANGSRVMPAFSPMLSSAQLDLLVTEVRRFDPARGRHAPGSGGATAPSRPDQP